MATGKLLIYMLRRDLRVSDNPILHHLSTSKDHGFTHLLPIYVFPSHQIETSGFLKDGCHSPYPQARSDVGKFWRCGPHRAKFIAQSVWDMKTTLENLDSGLVIHCGSLSSSLQQVISQFQDHFPTVSAVWMTQERSYEEYQEEKMVREVCLDNSIEFKSWVDEKYLIDDRDTGLQEAKDLPDVFTSYRKSQEPIRERPRPVLPRPQKSSLPPLPSSIPTQFDPFIIPESLEEIESRLLAPLGNILKNPPQLPKDVVSAHPFLGGESVARERLDHLIKSGSMTNYKDTRNGMVGTDYSTKLSGYLALGCLSARQIHHKLLGFEEGTNPEYKSAEGYGKGENAGTSAVRFELLWRDYMRLCMHKFGTNLFKLPGFRNDHGYNNDKNKITKSWKSADKDSAMPGQDPSPARISKIIERFLEGTVGMGLIDASQRELFHTGYTSNRARQNVASFFSKHLSIDWRYGAEWYESMLVDYDVSSNWSNWQYVAGVGNDPRGDARIFNPIKQAFDYDAEGIYVRMWVPEVRGLEKPEHVFQPCTAGKEDIAKAGLTGNIMVTDPIKRIDFMVGKKPRGPRKPSSKGRGGGQGGGRRGGGNQGSNNGPRQNAPLTVNHNTLATLNNHGQQMYHPGYNYLHGPYNGRVMNGHQHQPVQHFYMSGPFTPMHSSNPWWPSQGQPYNGHQYGGREHDFPPGFYHR